MPVIGVSVAVPEPHGARLQDYRISLGDAEARQIPTHITLVPPCEVGAEALDRVEEHLAGVAARTAPFRVHLRGTGTFRPRSPVVFVGVVEGISACERLAADLRSGPLDVEVEFPYHPHVTVAHHLADEAMDRAFEELSGFDATFEVREFWLYMHTGAEGWQPVRSHPLGG
ncbi:MAG TPA: 2'-5' RNA ligase family protein [Marmoricola sp.]|nr:2'-5' RNA ligase family protein [Marmoricola sp.]